MMHGFIDIDGWQIEIDGRRDHVIYADHKSKISAHIVGFEHAPFLEIGARVYELVANGKDEWILAAPIEPLKERFGSTNFFVWADKSNTKNLLSGVLIPESQKISDSEIDQWLDLISNYFATVSHPSDVTPLFEYKWENRTLGEPDYRQVLHLVDKLVKLGTHLLTGATLYKQRKNKVIRSSYPRPMGVHVPSMLSPNQNWIECSGGNSFVKIRNRGFLPVSIPYLESFESVDNPVNRFILSQIVKIGKFLENEVVRWRIHSDRYRHLQLAVQFRLSGIYSLRNMLLAQGVTIGPAAASSEVSFYGEFSSLIHRVLRAAKRLGAENADVLAVPDLPRLFEYLSMANFCHFLVLQGYTASGVDYDEKDSVPRRLVFLKGDAKVTVTREPSIFCDEKDPHRSGLQLIAQRPYLTPDFVIQVLKAEGAPIATIIVDAKFKFASKAARENASFATNMLKDNIFAKYSTLLRCRISGRAPNAVVMTSISSGASAHKLTSDIASDEFWHLTGNLAEGQSARIWSQIAALRL